MGIGTKIKTWAAEMVVKQLPFLNQTMSLTNPNLPAGIKFFYNNGELQWEACNDSNSIKKIYETCAPVSSIIDNMADAFVNGEMSANNVSAVRKKKREINQDWQSLLDQPNWMQDQSQFFKQLYTYRKMFGWCYVLRMYGLGRTNRPTSLWVLPNWLLDIEYEQEGLYTTKNGGRKVKLNWGGRNIPLDIDDLILFTDTTNIFNENTWLPLPRIFTKQYSLTLLLSILEAEATLIQNKGALGIISSNQVAQGISIPLSEEDKIDLQSQWGKYGLTRKQWQMMFTNANINYTPLVFDSAKLELKAGYLNSFKDCCDGLHYPFILTAHSDQSTYNNRLEATKDLYQEAIIPDAKSIFKTLAKGLGVNEANIELDCTYTHVEALQENKKDAADARRSMNQACKIEWDNGIITKNMWLEKIGEETIAKPEFNKYKYELTPAELGILNDVNNEPNGETQSGQGSAGSNQGGEGPAN